MLEQRYFANNNQPKFKIIMVGDSNVGKTAIFTKYIEEGQFVQTKNQSVTIVDFKIKEVQIQNKTIKLYIWDTAGQQKYRAMVSSYFVGCQGIMLVFDLTDPSSYVNATTKWYEIAKNKCPNAVIALIGNKRDLELKVDEQEVRLWAKNNGVQYMRTSVKNDINVKQCFQKLSDSIFNLPVQSTKTQSFSLRKNDLSAKDKKNCC